MKNRRIFSFCFISMMSVLLISCQAPRSYNPDISSREMVDEEAYQQRMVDEVAAKGGNPKPWRNRKNMRKQFEEVGGRVEKAGAELCRGLGLQKHGCYYYFILSRNEAINSVADGKNIYIYQGMMRFVESDDELAVVMAHELSHNLMQHVQAQKNNAMVGLILGAAVDTISGYQGVSTNGGMAESGSMLATLAYSVDFEKEADYIGLYIMARAGYNIKKAPDLWRRMSLEDAQGIYASYTHPSNAERAVALSKAVYEIEYKRKNKIALLPDLKVVD